MTKIRITEKQYELILLHEKENKSIIKEGQDAITVDLNVLLGITSILGFNLSGMNEIKAEKALKDEKVYNDIKETLENKDKLDELVKSLEIKGMANPAKKIYDKMSSLISKFNSLAKENGFDVKLTSKAMVNLNSLDPQ